MRKIGSLPNAELARRFTDVLLANGMEGKDEEEGEEWAIWVKNEDHVDGGKGLLVEFRSTPDAPQFLQAVSQAAELRRHTRQQETVRRNNLIDVRRQWHNETFRLSPLVVTVLAICVAVYVANPNQDWMNSPVARKLLFQEPTGGVQVWRSIRAGEVWRLFTPAVLHAGIAHIAFNLVWWVILAGPVERRQGTMHLLVLVLFLAGISNVAQALAAGPLFGGMSGIVYGLLGYLWLLQRLRPDLGYTLNSQAFFFLIVFLILGCLGGVQMITGRGVANWAHVGGLLAGLASASFVGFWGPKRNRSVPTASQR